MFRELFSVPFGPRDAWDVVRWWEWRRLAYNAVVGIAGLVTVAILLVINTAVGIETVAFVIGPLLVGIGANICYTAGWIVELAVRWLGRPRLSEFLSAPRLFALGLYFSLLVVFFPAGFSLFLALTVYLINGLRQ